MYNLAADNTTRTFIHPPVQVHLNHDTAPEGIFGGRVHPPPVISGDEVSKEEVMEQEGKIKQLVDHGLGTTELHKYLQRHGKRLGDPGKQKVKLASRLRENPNSSANGAYLLRAVVGCFWKSNPTHGGVVLAAIHGVHLDPIGWGHRFRWCF